MASPEEFIGHYTVVVGVMIPVGLRYYFKRNIQADADGRPHTCPKPAGPFMSGQGQGSPLTFISVGVSELGSDIDSDEDIILEEGAALVKA